MKITALQSSFHSLSNTAQGVLLDTEDNNSRTCPISIQPPAAISVITFEASTTLLENITRLFHYAVVGLSGHGVIMLIFTGSLPLFSYPAFILAVRKIISICIAYFAYPAAFDTLFGINTAELASNESIQTSYLQQQGFTVQKISLYKSGTQYDARIIQHTSTANTGYWTINLLGNNTSLVSAMSDLASENLKNHSNTLIVDGPSVGASGGWPTRYQLGAGPEAAMQYLETGKEVYASHIVLKGYSLGGGTMAEGILQHDFTMSQELGMHYLAISDRTFSKLSTIAGGLIAYITDTGEVTRKIIESLFWIVGLELDGIAAARKLSQLKITQIALQHNSSKHRGNDDTIPDIDSLTVGMHNQGISEEKVFLESPKLTHFGPYPQEINTQLDNSIKNFFSIKPYWEPTRSIV